MQAPAQSQSQSQSQSGAGQLGGPIGTHGNVLPASVDHDAVGHLHPIHASSPASAARPLGTLSLMSAVGGARKPAPDLVVPFALPSVQQVKEWRSSQAHHRKRRRLEQICSPCTAHGSVQACTILAPSPYLEASSRVHMPLLPIRTMHLLPAPHPSHHHPKLSWCHLVGLMFG
ncbi:hypothetical protein IE81DRAFT_167363 [Ceraceosorus guamensis]|uniref:Uncharacterized protein n=1 Tax=Ceraceosorus guamensis TaxID=1522189 RepID=A0A316W9K0_9BASI|nr:hypothetical protein IE81DRAFT_167363 [Ceraceosorus guamensis]PWN45738.1 hypothetical protein IE81DRAFT_167363 [Ceraceosorus guamensis]